MNKFQYSEFVLASNIPGSGKASSYIRALDLLSEMLAIEPFGFSDCIDIWSVSSVKRLEELKSLIVAEVHKGDNSVWLSGGAPKSYLLNGYCSAAVSSYIQFLQQQSQEDTLFDTFIHYEGSTNELIKTLDVDIENKELLIEGLAKKEGEDVIREVKARRNQNLFRRMILNIYDNRCCITGLNIPQLNRASHIIPWAEAPMKRLDPTNGLCLSATYDVAFDQYLIGFDSEYRLVVSDQIKEHYSNDAVKTYFSSVEGQVMQLPGRYQPNKTYLQQHLNKVRS